MSSKPWDIIASLGIRYYSLNDEVFQLGIKAYNPLTKYQFTLPEEKDVRDELTCNAVGCNTTFSSISELESHQRTRHTHFCLTCRAIMPSHHLLDRHILEVHDSFFQILAQKKPMYACLLECCKEVFQTPFERKRHCIKEHKFPSDFRFDLEWRKLKNPKPDKPRSLNTNKNNKLLIDGKCSQENTTNSTRLQNPDNMECSFNEGTDTLPANQHIDAKFANPKKVPLSFSFGYGVSRSFHTKRGRGKHWHQKERNDATRTHLEKISMNDINEELEAMES